MARKTVEICTCDICEKETEVQVLTIPIRWTTEQNEGRCIKPYITTETKDICNDCLVKICVVDVSGAQGHNHYEIVR